MPHPHTHTPTLTCTHTHSPPRSPAGKGWVRSNRNPRDLKRTDEQRQVETASSPSQTIRWQQSTHILYTNTWAVWWVWCTSRTVGVDDVPECGCFCFHHQLKCKTLGGIRMQALDAGIYTKHRYYTLSMHQATSLVPRPFLRTREEFEIRGRRKAREQIE